MTIEIKKPSYESKQLMTVNFEMKAFSRDEKYFYFEGYLSTFGNEDRGGDVVEKGAFDESLKEHTPMLLAFHKTDEPLGVFDSLVPDEKGLYIKSRMPLEDSYCKERIIPQMEIGSIKKMSIGYSVWGEDGEETSNGVRHLKRVFLWEGSLVTIAMNDNADIKNKSAMPFQSEMPIADRPQPWDEILALGRLRDWAGAEDEGIQDPEVQAKYKQAFLWFDEEDQDLLAAYRLPVADIVQGKLTIVPRAVFAAAGRINGSRGGIWIPRDERPRVMVTIEKYYEKMGLTSPFGKSFRIDDFSAIDTRTLEKLFCDGICMSEKNSKTLISYIKSGLKRDVSSGGQRDAEKDELKSNELETIIDSLKSIN